MFKSVTLSGLTKEGFDWLFTYYQEQLLILFGSQDIWLYQRSKSECDYKRPSRGKTTDDEVELSCDDFGITFRTVKREAPDQEESEYSVRVEFKKYSIGWIRHIYRALTTQKIEGTFGAIFNDDLLGSKFAETMFSTVKGLTLQQLDTVISQAEEAEKIASGIGDEIKSLMTASIIRENVKA